MSDDRAKLLSLVSNDLLGLLKPKTPPKSSAGNSVLLNNFEEIVDFFESHHRLPQESQTNIKEFQLYCRLKQIKSHPEFVRQLRDYDFNGLLSGEDVVELTLDDLINEDPFGLLDDDLDMSIFTMTNVKRSTRISPEYVARREFCENFEEYEPMFEILHEEMDNGARKLAVYHPEDLIPGRFFVLGGIMLFLKSVEGKFNTYQYQSGDYTRYDGRTECIFDNGTVSHMLYRSLNKALQKDGYSITQPQEARKAAEVGVEDKEFGYVYVLKSRHSKLRRVPDVYKIGSTTTSVTERTKNAKNEATYLYAGVDLVQTFRCFNMSARILEDKVQTFFDSVRLNINIPDEHGAIISPREWFYVNVNVIGEAIDFILAGEIDNYVYDPEARQIVAKRIDEQNTIKDDIKELTDVVERSLKIPKQQFTVYPQAGSTVNLGCQMQSPEFKVIPSFAEQQPQLESRSETIGNADQKQEAIERTDAEIESRMNNDKEQDGR